MVKLPNGGMINTSFHYSAGRIDENLHLLMKMV